MTISFVTVEFNGENNPALNLAGEIKPAAALLGEMLR
jgi:hypothetical protein